MSGADWIIVLREACERASQSVVARKLGYSPSTINRVLRGAYAGDISRIEQAVRGALMGATVDCPIVGEIPRHRCLANQRQPWAATNPTRVQLYRACRSGCPHSTIGGNNQ